MNNSNEKKDKSVKTEQYEWLAFRLLFDTSLSEERLDKIRLYFADGKDSELKREALNAALYAALRSAKEGYLRPYAPDADDIELQWARVAATLGLNPDLNYLRTLDIERESEAMPLFPVVPVHPVRRVGFRRAAVRFAAVMLPAMLLIGGGYLWFGRGNAGSQEGVIGLPAPGLPFIASHTVATGTDGVRHLVLADGTEVTLNRNTSFSYNDNREAELSGEAYFKVAKDPAHPFTIHSEHLDVRVLGTEFNFSTQTADGHSALSLYEGVVELAHAAGTHRLDTAGREFTLDHATAQTDIHDFDMSAGAPVWFTTSMLNMMSLGDIFDSIESAYDIRIEGREAVDTSRRYNFTLDGALTIDEVMSALEYVNGNFGYTIDGSTITLDKK